MTAKPCGEGLAEGVGNQWLMDNECSTDPVLGDGGKSLLGIVLFSAENFAEVVLVVDGKAAFVLAPLASVVGKFPGG